MALGAAGALLVGAIVGGVPGRAAIAHRRLLLAQQLSNCSAHLDPFPSTPLHVVAVGETDDPLRFLVGGVAIGVAVPTLAAGVQLPLAKALATKPHARIVASSVYLGLFAFFLPPLAGSGATMVLRDPDAVVKAIGGAAVGVPLAALSPRGKPPRSHRRQGPSGARPD